MRTGGLLLSLAGCAALWGWALFAPKRPPPLPDRLAREFRLLRFEPADVPTPYGAGQKQFFRFRPEGTYLLRFLVTDGIEMTRWEGTVELEGEHLTLQRVSINRIEVPGEPERYRFHWQTDAEGETLVLANEQDGFRMFLRPTAD